MTRPTFVVNRLALYWWAIFYFCAAVLVFHFDGMDLNWKTGDQMMEAVVGFIVSGVFAPRSGTLLKMRNRKPSPPKTDDTAL